MEKDSFETLLDLAEKRGFRFVPLNKDRTPVFGGWPNKASSDIFTLKKWNESFQNWGLVTGRDSGVLVVDLDVKGGNGENGISVWKRLLKENGTSEPTTIRVKTPSGGVHIYYKYPDDYRLGNTVSKIGDGIDTRGEDGYVVVPPSRYGPNHPELDYSWETDPTQPLAELPKWLLDLLMKKESQGQTMLEGKIPQGQRNVTLFKQAAKFRRSGMTEDEIYQTLQVLNQARCEPPLEEAEIRKIASSVEKYTADDPMIRIIEKTGVDDKIRFSQENHSRTDLGNARRMEDLYRGHFYYVAEWKRWAAWTGKRWDTRGNWEFINAVQKMTETIELEATFSLDEDEKKDLYRWAFTSQNSSRISGCETESRALDAFFMKLNSRNGLQFDDLEGSRYLLNCPNGTVNLKTGELYEHRKSDLLTQITAIPYNPNAEASRWERFLLEIMGGDEDMVHFLHKAIGYSLSGDISEQCFFILYGNGRNGKSTFLETISGIFGPDYAINSPTSMIIQSYGNSIPNDVARLWNKRFTTVNEIESEERLAESKVKQMTGGDTMTARFMREEYFDFVPRFKLWVRANHKPKIFGTDEAMWRRIRLIPFTEKFSPSTPGYDPYLYQKLAKESEGVLAWAVRGFRLWQKERLEPLPPKVSAATEHYKQESNDLLAFLNQVCVISVEGNGVRPSDLLEEYNTWAKMNRGSFLNHRTLHDRLATLGVVQKKVDGYKYCRGIDFAGTAGDSRPPFTLSEYTKLDV